MPEFFEVKRMKDYMAASGLVGDTLLKITAHNRGERTFKSQSLPTTSKILANEKLTKIETKAKYTLLYFPKGILVWHYRFTGVPHVEGNDYGKRLQAIHSLPIDQYPKKFIRFSMHFAKHLLHFVDSRCLSHVNFYPTQNAANIPLFDKVAPDLLHYNFPSFSQWKKELKSSKTMKSFLQDQSIPPSGIGNYVACEILFKAKLNPWLPTEKLTKTQYDRLVDAVKWLCTISDQREDYHWFYVYNQKKCKECKYPILRKKHRNAHSQTTHFCPICQA